MRLKLNEIERLSRRIIETLNDKKLFVPKVALPKLIQRIQEVVLKNMEEEEAIDRQVAQTMTQFEEQIRRGEVEHHRMLQMVKKQIAKEKKFVI